MNYSLSQKIYPSLLEIIYEWNRCYYHKYHYNYLSVKRIKNPIDISFVENPPVANIVIPCAILSNKVIPVRNNDNEQRIVNKI